MYNRHATRADRSVCTRVPRMHFPTSYPISLDGMIVYVIRIVLSARDLFLGAFSLPLLCPLFTPLSTADVVPPGPWLHLTRAKHEEG